MISESARPTSAATLPDAPPPAAPPADAVTIRRVETLAEYQACVAIQEETWGDSFSERVPATILMIAEKLDGVVAAAFDPGGRMLGFVFGLTGLRDGRPIHWSDMLAVRAEARGARLGERLKHYQRDLVRALGVETMFWTFDPLVARNAHLNIDRLGARVDEYVPNMYGNNTGSPLHGTLATDRFIVEWNLHASDGAPHRGRTHEPRGGVTVNPPGPDGVPAIAVLPDVPVVRIMVPRDVHALPLEPRAAWRATTRAAFLHYLGRGYDVVGFHRGDAETLPCYELARP